VLSGLMGCGRCGRVMYIRYSGGRQRFGYGLLRGGLKPLPSGEGFSSMSYRLSMSYGCLEALARSESANANR